MTARFQKTLAELYKKYGKNIVSRHQAVEGALRDRFPDARREVHALASALRCGHTQTLLAGPRTDPRVEVRRIANQLHHDFGMEFSLSVWAAETWAVGAGALEATAAGNWFSCQLVGCSRRGYADSRWRAKNARCPSCQSVYAFSDRLEPTLITPGTLNGAIGHRGAWILFDDSQLDGDLARHVELGREIASILATTSLTGPDKARILLLPQTCTSLSAESLACLTLPELRDRCMHIFRRAVIDSLLSVLGVNQPKTEHDSANLRDIAKREENVCGIIDLGVFDLQDSELVFSNLAMYFPASSMDVKGKYIRIPFEDFPSCSFAPAGEYDISVGISDDLIRLSGCTLRRRDVLAILNIIRSFELSVQKAVE